MKRLLSWVLTPAILAVGLLSGTAHAEYAYRVPTGSSPAAAAPAPSVPAPPAAYTWSVIATPALAAYGSVEAVITMKDFVLTGGSSSVETFSASAGPAKIELTYGSSVNWSFIIHRTTTGSRLIEKSDCTSFGTNYYASATEHDVSNGPFVTAGSPMAVTCEFSVAAGDEVIITTQSQADSFPRWASVRGVTQATIAVK